MKKLAVTILIWLQYLSLGVWVGGLVCVAIFAPVTFRRLDPDRFTAGDIVGGTLERLGTMNLACGVVFLAAAAASLLLVKRPKVSHWRILPAIKIILPLLMVLLTAYLVFQAGPRMKELRRSASTGSYTEWHGEAKEEFDRLHRFYTAASQGILFAGAALFLLLAAESANPVLFIQIDIERSGPAPDR